MPAPTRSLAPPEAAAELAPEQEPDVYQGVTDDLLHNYQVWYASLDAGEFDYEHAPRPETRQEQVLHNTAVAAAGIENPAELRGLVKIAPGGGKSFLLARHAQGFGMGQRDQNGRLLRTCIIVGTSDGADSMAENPEKGLQLFAGPDSPHPIPVQRFPSDTREFAANAGAYVMTARYLARMPAEELQELRSRVAMVQVDEPHLAIGDSTGDRVNELSKDKVTIAYDATPTYSPNHNAQDRLGLTQVIDDQRFVDAILEGQSPGVQAIAVHTGQVLTVRSARESITDSDLSELRTNMARNTLAVDWVALLTSRGITGMVRGIRGGAIPAEHAVMIRDMIRERNESDPIINPKTGRPIVVEAVGSFQSKEQNNDIRRRHDAGEIDWVIAVDMWTHSRDPTPGVVRAIIDMRAGTSVVEKEQLPGRMNRNDPTEIVLFIEFIDALVKAERARSRRLASIFDVLGQDRIGRDGSVVVTRKPPSKPGPGAGVPPRPPIDVALLPESLRAGALALAGQILDEVLVVGTIHAPLPEGSRPLSDLPIAAHYSDPTVRTRVLGLGLTILPGPGGKPHLSPEHFALASLIQPEVMSDGELLPTHEALKVAGVGWHTFNKTAIALGIKPVVQRAGDTQTRKPAHYYSLSSALAIRLAAHTELPPINAETDETLADIARELDWHLSALHLALQRVLHGTIPVFECSIPRSRPASCVSKESGKIIRTQIGHRMTEDMVPMGTVAESLRLTEHATFKLLGQLGLDIVKIGRGTAPGFPVQQQQKYDVLLPDDHSLLLERLAAGPETPITIIRDFIEQSPLPPSQWLPVLAFITNLRAKSSLDKGLSKSIGTTLQHYLANHQDELGPAATEALAQLFVANRPFHAARWILQQLASNPDHVEPLASQPHDADLVAYLEDVLIRYVAKLVRPLLHVQGDHNG